MPTKRRPLQHGTIGEIRVTERLLDLYRQWQLEGRGIRGRTIEQPRCSTVCRNCL
jgi:hypothetical protein